MDEAGVASLRVLVVDDNPDDRELTTHALQRAFPSITVLPVRDLLTLSERLEAGDFDAVITDYQLRWSTGLDVLRAVRSRYPNMIVIMFTSTGTQEVAVEAMKEGLDDYVIKAPAHFVRLPGALRRALDRAAAHQRANDALAARERFLIVASHELRTPLTTILGSLAGALARIQRLADRLPEQELAPVVSALERALRQGRRLDRLQEHIALAVSLELEATEPQRVRVDLVALLREAITSQQEFTPARVVTFAGPLHLWLETDPSWVAQIATALLENALKFSQETRPVGVRVSVESRDQQHVARVSVSDQGPGIAVAEQNRIWDRFYRQPALSHVSGSSVGLGLGLPMARTLVERLGGETTVESSPGAGSTFTFTLPLAERTPADEAEPSGS